MNKLAKKRILIVLAVSGVLVVGAGGLYGYRKHRIANHFESLRESGMAAAAADDYPKAVADLQQYLVRHNDDVEALAAYSRVRPKVISADRSHLRETMQALRYYVSLKPDAVQQRRELLDLYLTYNLNTEALDTADRLLATAGPDAELLAARTKALTRLRRSKEALAAAEAWAAAAPADAEAHQYRLELLKAGGADDASIARDAEALVAAHPTSVGMRLVKAQTLLMTNKTSEAIATLKEAAAMPGGSVSERRALATTMDQVGLFDDSLAILTALADGETPATTQPSDQRSATLLARRLWERGDSAAFLAFLEKRPELVETEPDLLALRGFAHRMNGDTAAADADLAKLELDPSPHARAWAAVVKSSTQAMTVELARKQIELINDALVDRPNDAYLLHFLGEAYAKAGDHELAVSIWQRAARAAPAWAIPPMRASSVLVSQNRFDEAFNLAAMAAARSQRLALQNYVQVWTAAVEAGRRSDGAELLRLLDQAIAQTSGQGWLHVARATVLCRLGRADEARQSISEQLARNAEDFDQASLLRLAALSRIHKLSLDEAIEQKLRAEFGVTAEGAVTTFFRVFLSDGKDAALAGFEKAREASGKPDARDWLLSDARVRDFVQDENAERSWKTLLATYGNDVEVIQSALGSSSLWRDRPTIDGLIDKLRSLSDDRGMAWRLLRARWLLEGSTDEAPDLAAAQKASDLLTAVLLATPENVQARFWQARSQIRLGNKGSAIEHLMTASRLAPRSGPIALYTARLLQDQGDFVRAREQLDRLTSADLGDPEQNAMAAQLLAQQGQAQQAIDLLEQTRNLGMSEQSDLLLAMLYQRQGATERTEAIISRLMQKPTLSTVAFAADFYRAQGKADVAEQTLNKLYELQLAPGVREMTLADFHLRRGDLAQAEKFGEAATVASPDNVAAWRGLIVSQLAAGKPEVATATLDRAAKAIPTNAYLTELRSSAVWPLVVAGKSELFRPLALRLAADPQNQPLRQALTLVASENGAATPGLIAGLKQIAQQNPLNQSIQIVAGQLLLNAGRPDEAAALATKGVQTFPTDETLPRLAAQSMLSAGQWSQARTFAQTWRRQAGADVLPADLLGAIAALQMGAPADAESLLRPHVPFAMDRLDRHGDLIRTFATSLYLQAKTTEAQEIVEKAIARNPAFAREWAATAAGSLPTADAVAWFARLDPQWTSVSDQTLAARLLLQIAMRPDAPSDTVVQLKTRLETLERESSLDAESLIVLGVIADQIGDDERAERLYRRALETGQQSPIVLNNLSMLLLQQNRSLDEAETLAAKAVADAPETTVYADTLAQVLLGAKKFTAARSAIDRALSREPNNPLWKLTAAEVAAAEGESGQAQRLVEELLGSPSVRQSLGPDDIKRAESLQNRVGTSATQRVPAS